MALYREDGTELTDADVTATAGSGTPGPATYTVGETIIEDYTPQAAAGTATKSKRIKFHAGQKITQAQLDEVMASNDPTIASIEPAAGPAAGGTAVTITGTALDGATGVTFGGAAGTAFSVTNDRTLAVTTPAGTAGPADVVVQHPNGDVTETAGFTYE